MRHALYESATGLLVILDHPFRALGYAGRGPGRNNPTLQDRRNVGPLPVGDYQVSLPYRHHRKGPMVFKLTPDPRNQMFGRSGFLIHGDNTQGDASEGCIILDRSARDSLARYQVRRLTVVALLPCVASGEAVNSNNNAQVTPPSARGH